MSTTHTATRFETASIISQDVEDLFYQCTSALELSGMSFSLATFTLSQALLSPPVQGALHARIHQVYPRYPQPALQRHRLIRDAAQRHRQTLRNTNQHATTPDNLVFYTSARPGHGRG